MKFQMIKSLTLATGLMVCADIGLATLASISRSNRRGPLSG